MDLTNLKKVLENEPKFRYKQIYTAVYRQFVEDWEEASNIPKGLREELKEQCPLEIPAEMSVSSDKKTVKAAIHFSRGVVESVLMRYGKGRNTVCVSTQVGCAMGCSFCVTGQLGWAGNLSYTEIVQQVLIFERYLKSKGETVTNVVFMGMGEPMMNYDQVIRAAKFLNDPDFFNIGARRMSISTVGIPEGIKKLFSQDLQINLAVSLNAPSNTVRDSIMPINSKYPLGELLDTVSEYIERTGREVMMEYIMLAGVNDSVSQAYKLSRLLKDRLGKHFKVNLIEFNPSQGYKGTSSAGIQRFRSILEEQGVKVIQRYKFGRDIKAACGQLAGEKGNTPNKK